jgi:PAS domain S-box-containing protein
MVDSVQNIAGSDDALIVADLRGEIVSVAGAYEAMFGHSESDLIGKNVDVLIPEGLRPNHKDHVARFSQRPHARTMGIGLDLNAVHADGSMIPVEVSLRVLEEGDQQLVRAVVRRATEHPGIGPNLSELMVRVRQAELTSATTSDVFTLAAEITSQSYGGRPVGIWRYDEAKDGYVLEDSCNVPAELEGKVIQRDSAGLITQATFVQGLSVVDSGTHEVRRHSFMDGLGLDGGIASVIGGRYEPYGAITVHFGSDDRLGLEDTAELQAISTELSRYVLSVLAEEAFTRETAIQENLAEIGRVFASSYRLEEVYETFVGLVNDLIPHTRITLASIDQDAGIITTRYAINTDGSDIEGWESGTEHALAGTSAESMSATKRGLFINFADPEEFSQTLSGAPEASAGLNGVLNLPLIVSGSVVGSLTLNSSGEQTFTDQSLQLGERVAAQISGSFLNSLLSESLEKEATRRESLNRISEVVGSNLDLAEIFTQFAEVLNNTVVSDLVVITDVDVFAGSKLDILVAGKNEYEQTTENLTGTISGLVTKSQRTVAVDVETVSSDVSLSESEQVSGAEGLKLNGMLSWIATPLTEQEEVIGVLHVLTDQKPTYDRDEIEFIEAVASRVAVAMANSRLHEAAQEYARRQELLAQISRDVSTSLDSDVTFEKFAAVLSELIPVDRLTIMNVDVRNETAEVLYLSISGKYSGAERRRLSTVGTPAGHVAEIGETVLISDSSQVSRFPNWTGWSRGANTSITVPMGRGGGFAQIFQISSSEFNAYDSEQVAMIEQIANQISGAVANQQLYRRSMELGEERERSIRLEAERSRLSAVNDAKNEFLNLLSHELKTPLTSIIAFADLLKRDKSNELSRRQGQHLDVIQRNAWHLDSLIQDLVDVSSIERGVIELVCTNDDVGQLVAGVIEGMQPNLNEKSQRLQYSNPEGPVVAFIDRQRVVQVISNLVSNASKYSSDDTTISLEVGSDADFVSVKVSDEGPGIPKDQLAHVFDLFHRVDNESTRQVPGTGQGLYLVKQLVQLHGGRVGITSEDSGDATGTSVTVEFPINAS